MTLVLKVKVKYTENLSNANSSVSFLWNLFIFSTIVAYDNIMLMTSVLDHRYDLGIKGQAKC